MISYLAPRNSSTYIRQILVATLAQLDNLINAIINIQDCIQ